MARMIIVGSGVVGTATGTGFARMGHQVQFVDIMQARVDTLRGLGYSASTKIDLTGPEAYIILTLPTPHEGRRYDLRLFTQGVRDVAEALKQAQAFHTVVVRSTVPPNTCEGLVQPELEEISGKRAGVDFGLASNPEFLRAECAAEDFLNPWMTILASRSKRTIERLLEIYKPFGGEIQTFSKPAEAELIKCSHNVFNAVKISYWNDIWRVAKALNLDADRIADTVSRSAEGSWNVRYGVKGGAPYGGACLPKDTNGLYGFASELGIDMPVLNGTIITNEIMEKMSETAKSSKPAAQAGTSATQVKQLVNAGSASTNGHASNVDIDLTKEA